MLVIFLISLFGFILLNVPIAFALILTTVILMMFQNGISPEIITQSLIRGVDSFPLMAIPFFLLAGDLMNVGGISKRIVLFSKSLLGHVTGGLGYVTVLASMLFAGVSGSAIADTTAIGSIMLPVMEEQGYDKKKSVTLIAAAGCIGPIIPPSIPMIVLGVTASVSIVKLFLGGIVPGILIGLSLMTVWYFHAKKHGYKTDKKATTKEILYNTKEAIWALILPVIILGGIVSGIYTPTEAAVVAVVYALIVGAFVYKELKFHHFKDIFLSTAKGTATVMLVCGAATSAAYMITIAKIPQMLANALLSLSGNNVLMVMLLINILLLLVGCVMDLTPAVLILVPILYPIAESFGLDPIYFGVVIVVNLCIGLITPPVGTVLFVGCSLSKLSMKVLTKPILAFLGVMISTLMLITYFPDLILFIPRALGK